MIAQFKAIADAIEKSGLPKRATELDKKRSKAYWNTGRELSARSFESYIINRLGDAEASNDYQANSVSEEYWDAAEAMGLERAKSYP